MAEIPPPTYAPVPPRRRSSTGIIIGIVVGAILLACICCGIGGYWLYSNGKPIAECLENFQVAQEAVQDYANAHDGKLPDASKWQDEVRSYFGNRAAALKQSPFKIDDPNGVWSCNTGGSPTGIAFNSDLSGKKMSEIKDPYSTPLLYEVPTPSTNANGPYRDNPNRPQIFGKPRPWIIAYVEGKPKMPGTNVEVNTDSGG